MLANGFLIFFAELRVPLLDDLAHAHLGQLFRHRFLVKQAALKSGLVLHEGGDDLVEVLLADALGFVALRGNEPVDLHMKLASLLVEPDIGAVRIVTAVAIIVSSVAAAAVFWREVEARRQHLLHQQACRNGLQRIVDGIGDEFLAGVRLGDQIGEMGARLAGCVAGGAADDLDDLGEARSIADSQRVLAPNPVKAFLGHAERDDDVDIVAIVALRRVFQRANHLVAFGWLVFYKIGDLDQPAVLQSDVMEAGGQGLRPPSFRARP